MRRMQTIGELFANLKSYFVDKTNAGTEKMAGSLSTKSLFSVNGSSSTGIIDLGVVASTDLISSKLPAGFSGLYSFYVSDTSNIPVIALLKFSLDNSTASAFIFRNLGYTGQGSLQVLSGATFAGLTFGNLLTSGVNLPQISLAFSNVTSINSNLGGTPVAAVENSTLHIRGSFTPTATIAAGSKLFSTGQTLAAQMTHGSAINTGTAASAAFIGISIATNGDVYCLGALTSGVTYNIAVTATL